MSNKITSDSDGIVAAALTTVSPEFSTIPSGFIASLFTNSISTYIVYVPGPRVTLVASTSDAAFITLISPSSTITTIPASALASHPTVQSLPSSTIAQPSVSATTQPSDSLSTGAKAGIGIGATAGAVLLMLLGAFFSSIVRRRKPKEESFTYDRVEPESQVQRQMSKRELDGNNGLGRNISRNELDGTHWRRELEGDTPKGFDREQLQTVAEMDNTSAT